MKAGWESGWRDSLRLRLLLATAVAVGLAVAVAGWGLQSLFQRHVMQQLEATLTQQLELLIGQLEFDEQGRPMIDPAALYDPRWRKPYSGLYWQIDALPTSQIESPTARLRSRSLWDTQLAVPTFPASVGQVHVHHIRGPGASDLLALERQVQPESQSAGLWRLVVASDLAPTWQATQDFRRLLTLSLVLLWGLLMLAAWAQVSIGLLPLRSLQRSLQSVRAGQSERLSGPWPAEVQPLAHEFNRVLDHNDEVVARARTQAGNLAHALKTPLSVLAHSASPSDPQLAQRVRDQVQVAQRHVDWHLARARAAASERRPGLRCDATPVMAALVRVMEKIHADRHLRIALNRPAEALFFAGEQQDLHEIGGNLLDNACQWAHSQVVVTLRADAPEGRLVLDIEDDGPGIPDQQRSLALARGQRLDESTPGSGLGLAIVQDLVDLYKGQMQLGTSALGGLRVSVRLPKASPPAPS